MANAVRLGNEGFGLRPLVERVCDRLVFIEGQRAANPDLSVDSLNVAAATAVLVNQWYCSAPRGTSAPRAALSPPVQ